MALRSRCFIVGPPQPRVTCGVAAERGERHGPAVAIR